MDVEFYRGAQCGIKSFHIWAFGILLKVDVQRNECLTLQNATYKSINLLSAERPYTKYSNEKRLYEKLTTPQFHNVGSSFNRS